LPTFSPATTVLTYLRGHGMTCRVPNCGAQGLFHETNGYCPRCYEEIEAMKDKKLNPPPALLPDLAKFSAVVLAFFVLRYLWYVFFE